MKKILFTNLIFLFFYINGFAQISLVQFSTGYSSPVDIQNAGDSRLFIVEQGGRIYICDSAGVRNPVPFLNIQSLMVSGGERGLLGLAFDPDYKNNGYFYVYYTEITHGDIRISRFSVSPTNPDSALANSETIVITIWHPFSNHNGGYLGFRKSDGYLYIGTGDGGSGGDPGNRAQNKDSLLGKFLRLDVSSLPYTIPPDNPLVGIPGRDEIWNIGMRNPWRNSFDSWNSDFWMGDVGQNAWEEIDYQPVSVRGGNYGWRCYEGNHPYTTTGCGPLSSYIGPAHEYAQSGAAAVVGGYVYRGAKYANMFGKYFFTDQYTSNYGFHTLTPNGSGGFTNAALGSLGRSTVVAFGEDKWGELYCADYGNGRIYRFQGAPCQPVAFISEDDTIVVCGDTSTTLHTPAGYGFSYSWTWSGGPITADSAAIVVSQGGNYSVTVLDTSGCVSTSSTVYVMFASMPSVSFTGLDTLYCLQAPPVTLAGNPPGGIFSGHGITGTTFSPLGAGVGMHTIYYSATSDSGCTNTQSQQVRIDGCVGFNKYSSFSDLTVFPNPGNGNFTVSFYLLKDVMMHVEVTDVLGQMIYREEVHMNSGFHRLPLNLSGIAKGAYALKLYDDLGSAVKNFVVN